MELSDYTIISTIEVKKRLVLYEGYSRRKEKVRICEFEIRYMAIDDINDIYYKILIPADIANPCEILSSFLGTNGKLYIVLPFDMETITASKRVFLSYDDAELFNDYLVGGSERCRLVFVSGKKHSGKSYYTMIVQLYLAIKGYATYTYNSWLYLNSDSDVITAFMTDFEGESEALGVPKSGTRFSYFQEKYWKLFSTMLTSKLTTQPVALVFDNFEYLSRNLQDTFISLYKWFSVNASEKGIIFIITLQTEYVPFYLEGLSTYSAYKKTLQKIRLQEFSLLLNEAVGPDFQTLTKEMIAHIYGLTGGNLYRTLFLLSLFTKQLIPMNANLLDVDFEYIVRKLFSGLSDEERKLLYYLKAIGSPVSIHILKYLKDDIFGESASFDLFYESLSRLKNAHLISSFLLNKTVYFYLIFMDSLPRPSAPIDTAPLLEKNGDYYYFVENNSVKALHYYILAHSNAKMLMTIDQFIAYYKKMHDYEPIVFYIDKLLKTVKIGDDQRYRLLLEKAEVSFQLSLWEESLTMFYELLPYNIDTDRLYYLITMSLFYLGEYDEALLVIGERETAEMRKPFYRYELETIKIVIMAIKGDGGAGEAGFEEAAERIGEDRTLSDDEREELGKDLRLRRAWYYVHTGKISDGKSALADTKSVFFSGGKNDDDLPWLIELSLIEAQFFLFEKEFHKSISLLNTGMKYAEQIFHLRYISDIYILLAQNLYELKNLDSSLSYLKRAVKIKEELKHRYSLGLAHYYMALIYGEKGNYPLAMDSLIKALDYFRIINSRHYMKNALLLKVRLSFATRDYETMLGDVDRLNRNYLLTDREKNDVLGYIGRIQQWLQQITENLGKVCVTRDLLHVNSLIPLYSQGSSSRERPVQPFTEVLHSLVNRESNFERLYTEIFKYMCNYTEADLGFILFADPRRKFDIIFSFNDYGVQEMEYRDTLREIVKLSILQDERVTRLAYENDTMQILPLFKSSRLSPSRFKNISKKIRRNIVGYLFLVFRKEPNPEPLAEVSAAYQIINSLVVNSLEYMFSMKEKHRPAYRYEIFRQIALFELENCLLDRHPFAFILVDFDGVCPGTQAFYEQVSKDIAKGFRTDDIFAFISEKELIMFLPFAEEFGRDALFEKLRHIFSGFCGCESGVAGEGEITVATWWSRDNEQEKMPGYDDIVIKLRNTRTERISVRNRPNREPGTVE